MWVGSKPLAKNAESTLPIISSAAADFSRLHLQTAAQILCSSSASVTCQGRRTSIASLCFCHHFTGISCCQETFHFALPGKRSLAPPKGIASKATHAVMLLSSPTLGNSSALYLMQLGGCLSHMRACYHHLHTVIALSFIATV